MRRIVESTFVTLDGVIENPQNWGPPYWDDEHGAYAAALLERSDALLSGRATWDVFRQSWPERSGDPFADKMNAMPKYVASHTLPAGPADWNSTILGEDVVAEVGALKSEGDGDLLKFGSGPFTRTLLDAGLVDELHFWVFPVIAGSGGTLADAVADITHFELLASTPFRSGIVVHVCAPK